jgi:hypothetical protein
MIDKKKISRRVEMTIAKYQALMTGQPADIDNLLKLLQKHENDAVDANRQANRELQPP